MMTLRSVACGVVAMSLIAMIAYGQQPPPPPKDAPAPPVKPAPPAPPSDWNESDVRELVHAVMMARISRELNLSDEQTVLMMRRFDEHRESLEKIAANRNRALRDLKAAIADNAPDADMQNKLEAVVELDKRQAALRQEAFKNIATDMTPKQQAQMYVFIMDFESHMKRLILRAKELGGERLMRLRDESGKLDAPDFDRRPPDRPRRVRGDEPQKPPAPVPPAPKDKE